MSVKRCDDEENSSGLDSSLLLLSSPSALRFLMFELQGQRHLLNSHRTQKSIESTAPRSNVEAKGF